MLITLCYVLMWLHFQRSYSRLIHRGLRRLKGRSFLFRAASVSAASDGDSRSDELFLQRGDKAVFVTELQVVQWTDCCRPLAFRPGQPFRAVAQATVDNFARIGVAFIEDRLQLDDGLVPSKIVPVSLPESTVTELLEKQRLHTAAAITPTSLTPNQTEDPLPDPEASSGGGDGLHLQSDPKRKLEGCSEPHHCCSHSPDPVGEQEDCSLEIQHQMEGHGHHLHLSSCHECLELENSTILSVKHASAENIPELPTDSSVGSDGEKEYFEDTDQSADPRVTDQSSKPPNVLVYTDGCQERFDKVRLLLEACLNMEHNIVYPLRPQQALTDPWLDNTRLLVLADTQRLAPELQARVLSYLDRGGKVLGLASSLCPAGLSLELRGQQRMTVRTLSFTRKDDSKVDLRVVGSGKVYVRHGEGRGEVVVWGEFKGDVQPESSVAIVRVTQGQSRGQAVLSQVHFEVPVDSQTLEGLGQLKISNPPRVEVLVDILTSLGLNCELNQTPTPSPVHLLATAPEAKSRFLRWLQTRVGQDGVLTLSKSSLRIVSSEELHGERSRRADDSLPLVTDSSELTSSEHFCMQTYSSNLQTHRLGHTLLFAEVVTSTMDLLEGLTLHLPKDVSVMAVALRQSRGRGRGGNSWLSPVGCAMFTLGVQVEVHSRLGQRIPFLQHLAALAVVEAVRTLPGYEDIELRVKWPNDIYYRDQVKVGGVLVTSTVMGSTFYALIGCGFNVTNSSPSLCVNDLIQQHNHEQKSSLQPLSSPQLIARTVTCLETLINAFQRGGPEEVLPLYYRRWLHSGTRVRLWKEDGPEVQVVGLDHNGFLQVYSEEKGVASVEPDGNSFDMLKNLVMMKER